MKQYSKVFFSLGSNLGDKERNISEAIRKIAEMVGTVERQSTLYVTEPWGFESENMFVNAAICCSTCLSPRKVLEATKSIEREMGRKKKSIDGEYHDRIIDIDILTYDDVEIDEPDLKIPHPLMHERDFVMKPLGEIVDKKC